MAVKATIICAVALLIQIISGININPWCDRTAPWARTFLAWREANTNIAGSSMRLLKPLASRYLATWSPSSVPSALADGLIVTSSSNGPIGISVRSENIIEGPLAVAGQLPFLGSVEVKGVLPTLGSGAVSSGSGDKRSRAFAYKEYSRPEFVC